MSNGETDEKLWCTRSTLPLDRKDYPKSLRLTLKETSDPDGVTWVATSYNWPPGQVVLFGDDEFPTSMDMECSHLCNHSWCLNAGHLVWETRLDNSRRKNCHVWATCPHGHQFNPCPHTPQCLPLKKCSCQTHIRSNPIVSWINILIDSRLDSCNQNNTKVLGYFGNFHSRPSFR